MVYYKGRDIDRDRDRDMDREEIEIIIIFIGSTNCQTLPIQGPRGLSFLQTINEVAERSYAQEKI